MSASKAQTEIPLTDEDAAGVVDTGAMPGARIRKTRLATGMSLKALADAAGISIGNLSQIERGIANPSFRTVMKIQSALGVTSKTLFPHVPARQDDPSFVRRKDRRPLCDLGILTKELISTGTSPHLEMMLLHIPPGGSTGDAPLVSFSDKAGFVLSGEVVLRVGEQTTVLSEGDSFQFEGSYPHSVRNESGEDAHVLWLIINITLDRHL